MMFSECVSRNLRNVYAICVKTVFTGEDSSENLLGGLAFVSRKNVIKNTKKKYRISLNGFCHIFSSCILYDIYRLCSCFNKWIHMQENSYPNNYYYKKINEAKKIICNYMSQIIINEIN